MTRALRYTAGMAAAAFAMYWLDPTSGRRRRARLKDQFVSLTHRLNDGLGVASRDVTHRTQGLMAVTQHLFESDEASDEIVTERVRSGLGRVVSHPHAIEVTVTDGRVTLSGPVLEHEHTRLLDRVRAVRGVREVEDRLAVHKSANGIPSLQGGRPREQRSELMQENWSPTARLLTGAAGTALVLYGLRSRGFGHVATVAGSAVLLRAASNMPLKRLAGSTGRRAIDIRKTLHVRAPVEQVFETLAHYENFPAFMRNVRNVELHEDGRSHWTVVGPAGASVSWESVTTRQEPNQLLAWRTVPNSVVEHAGIIRFEPVNEQQTRLDIQMSYNPPAGALGHIVAKLFGKDPKTELDQDLVRMKTFLETGKPPRDAAARSGTQTAAL